jgi:hypothetical protein
MRLYNFRADDGLLARLRAAAAALGVSASAFVRMAVEAACERAERAQRDV